MLWRERKVVYSEVQRFVSELVSWAASEARDAGWEVSEGRVSEVSEVRKVESSGVERRARVRADGDDGDENEACVDEERTSIRERSGGISWLVSVVG